MLLTMEGFASFRDRAELDFREVSYFALVGRTGAGKSTVIDAITFALYGTADRWGRDNAIRYALAPTANQAKVSLVFDAGGKRYVIAREVRRSGQAPPVQKSVSLELLADQNGLGLASEEPGTVLAGNPKDARQLVTQLLGVDFDEFCKCVVLPQGKFSEFMVSQPRERREILSRLLGESRYAEMHQLANQRAENAAGQVAVLTGQLSQLAVRSEAEIDDLHRRHRRLVDLAVTVERRVGEMKASLAEIGGRAAATEEGATDLTLLVLKIPEDVRLLDGLAAEAQAEHELAEQAVSEADAAADTARVRQQARPSADRARQLLKDHSRLDGLLTDLPQLEESRERAATE
ncbi:MAG: AAA family ATPase, partial [Janthinobacterium lividum]